MRAKALVKDDNVSTAKEIIEWLGIIGGLGLLQYLRSKGDKSIQEETEIVDNDGNNKIEVKFIGSNNTVIISPEVMKLAGNHEIVKAAKGVVAPVANRAGIELAKFSVNGEEAEGINKEYAKEVSLAVIDDGSEPQYITAHITVHEVFFGSRTKKWEFIYNGRVERIDISSTDIGSKILKRGKAVVGDTYKVKLELIERNTPSGYKTDYKVIEVIDFYPGKEQEEMDV